jgi:hypothetical protein
MIERLIHSLQALAAPADAQLARFPDFVAKADELALDFADALRLVSDRPQVELSAAQREALARLDAQLDAMSGESRRALWSEAAMRGAREWAATRRLAREALAALHAPDDLPPPPDATYIRGAAP